MNPDYQKLENRVAALEKWKQQKTAQQISFPLDVQSFTILNDYFLTNTGNLDFTNASGQEFRTILVKQANKIYGISVLSELVLFTVNTTSDVVTAGPNVVDGTQGHFFDGNRVFLQSTGTLPSPLNQITLYYVINASGDGTTFQLSEDGVTPVNITDTGTGQQYMTNS